MKKLLTIITIFVFTVYSFSQESFKEQIILLPENEEATITLNGVRTKITSALICKKTAEIEFIQGNITALSDEGNEFSFKPGDKCKIIRKRASGSTLGKISKYMESPSSYLPNLYSSKRDDFYFFPVKSNLIDIKNIQFYYKEHQLCEPAFKMYQANNDSLIWQTSSLKNIKTEGIDLKQGENYYWKLYNGSNSIKGQLSYLSNSFSKKLSKKQLKSKKEYLEKYFLLLEKECYFDAVVLLNEALAKYPESSIFRKIKTILKMN